MSADSVQIDCFSDVLCIWAYCAHIRLDELRRAFGEQITLTHRFIPVFGDARRKIEGAWKTRDGVEGYAQHVLDVAGRFDHIECHPEVWTRTFPPSSANCHLFLTAIRLLEQEGMIPAEPQEQLEGRTLFEQAIWRTREAFFRELQDVSRLETQQRLADELGLPVAEILELLRSGEAMAELSHDVKLRDDLRLTGSPTLVLNQGRQKLYGNVGYRVIEANVRELLERPEESASWC